MIVCVNGIDGEKLDKLKFVEIINGHSLYIDRCFILDFVVGVLNSSGDKEQINKMQTQINELCRAIGHEELVSTYISDEEKELVLH